MANTKSAEKQNRQATKHRARNSSITSAVRTEVRKFRETLEGTDTTRSTEKTAAALKEAIKKIAKAATKGIIHKSQASRRIARLSKAAHGKAAPAAK